MVFWDPASVAAKRERVYVCAREERNWSALLAVFGYDSMESGSDKRWLGVMSHISCPCFLPSGLQMGRGMPCSPVGLLHPSTSSFSRELNHSWVFHPSLYFSAWPLDLCRILWCFWWRAVKSTSRPLPIPFKMEKEREREAENRTERALDSLISQPPPFPFFQLAKFNPHGGDSRPLLYGATCCIAMCCIGQACVLFL